MLAWGFLISLGDRASHLYFRSPENSKERLKNLQKKREKTVPKNPSHIFHDE
jgi:hypothetical protein